MALVGPEISIGIGVVLLLAIFGGGWLVGRLGIGAAAVSPASLTDLERQFTERMRGVTLIGSYTEAGQDRAPRSDRYLISSVEKVEDDLWQFDVSMDCCGVSGRFPVMVPMRWNGDTPMIMMTNTTLPGLGTFTVRLFFYGDRYAGTWQNGTVAGEMSGRVEQKV